LRLGQLNGRAGLRAVLVCGLMTCALGFVGGCDTTGFLDPTEMMRTKKDTLILPILKQVDPAAEEADTQYANATDPLPEDHKYSPTDYTISPNDLLAVTLSDVAGPNTESIRQARVSESGYISLPLIGSIKAAGLTEIELEDEIVHTYQAKNLIQSATVSVTVIEARGRAFSILGSVQSPGEYAIVETDFRLLNALVLARNVTSPFTDYIYIIRRPPPQHPASSRPVPSRDNMGNPVIPPPSTGPTTQELAPGATGPNSAPQPPIAKATPRERIVHLSTEEPADADALANQPVASKPEMLAEQAPEPAGSGGAATGQGSFSGFSNPDENNGTRVIRIPYEALRNGDLSYNIPIRPHDVIYVQDPNVGVYYMSGHVTRPGVYTFNGQKVTLKQAIASAAMLDGLAIPARTDIIRRIRPDHEVYVRVALDKIFSGEQPDVYLKPDDMVIVGTNAVAPFLAAIRGGFRVTYGFGFLYDRNYAYSTNVAGGF